MLRKTDAYYRHWFLDTLMTANIKLGVPAQNPICLDYILKQSKNKEKAEKAFYFLFATKSIAYWDNKLTGGIEHVSLRDKGRNELLSEYHLEIARKNRGQWFNNFLIAALNLVLILGIAREFHEYFTCNCPQKETKVEMQRSASKYRNPENKDRA